MGKTIIQFLEILFGFSVMAVAITLFALQANQTVKRQDIVSHYVDDSAVLSISENWAHQDEVLSYKELCTRIMYGISCDVVIDGTLIEQQWFNVNTFDYGIIQPGRSYKVINEYNDDGTLKSVSYLSL